MHSLLWGWIGCAACVDRPPAVDAALLQGVQGFLGLVDGYIAGIFVDAAARSKGIGHALIERAKQTEQKLTLQVYLQNERACRFYRREGFVEARRGTDPATGQMELQMIWTR